MNEINETNSIKERLNEMTLKMYSGTQLAFNDLETIKAIAFTLRVSVARLGDNPDTRALAKVADIITESINKIEGYTKDARDLSKQMGVVINQINVED